jgi:AcrR family transcriptional regulator
LRNNQCYITVLLNYVLTGDPLPDALTETKIADFRRRICDTAVRQLAENGIENLSMRSLAKELGYSATALYSYFKNKDDILAAVRTQTFIRLADAIESAPQASPDPWAKLRTALDAYGHFAFSQPTAYKLAFASDQPSPALYPELQMAETHFRQILIHRVENLVAAGLQSGDPTILAQVYWAALHGVIALRMAGKIPPSDTAVDSLWEETLALLTRGASGSAGKKVGHKVADQQFNLDL